MKIGTIGTGFIVDTFLHAIAHQPGIEVTCMYTRNETSAQSLAHKYQIKKIYTNLEDLLNDNEIDTIYVASPNSLHYQQAKAALLAGKNVICEKPFTTTISQLDDLIETVKKTKTYLFEAITTIHLPNYQALKPYLDSIKPIRYIDCNFSKYSSRYTNFIEGETPNIFNPDFSGGALMDLNIYNLHFVMNLFGKPNQATYFANMQRGIDTSGIAVLQYDGFIASCISCKDSDGKSIGMISGEKGTIMVDSTSGAHNVEINIQGKKTCFNLQNPEMNNLYYELGAFNQIIKNQEFEKMIEKLNYSKSVYEVISKMRKDCGLIFKDDKNLD